MGTSGNGNIMYGNETIDITTQILEFSNKKYDESVKGEERATLTINMQ